MFSMATLKSIGQKIVQIRKDKGYSQEDLAGFVDMDRSYLSEIENGQKNLSVMMLIRISNALDVKPEDILRSF